MTTEYKLVAFSRDVNYGTSLGKHSGYGLIKYENGVPVAMKTVEVTASSSFGNMNFANSNDFSSGYSDGWIPVNSSLSIGGNIVPEKTFENGQWQETTSDWVSDRGYKSIPLKDGNGNDFGEPVDAYRQIENVADYLDQSGISYDPLHQNCNSWATDIARRLFPDINIIEMLNDGVIPPDNYTGSDYMFPASGMDIEKWNALMDILKFIQENNLSVNDVTFEFSGNLFEFKCKIIYNSLVYTTDFELNGQMPPITVLKENKETAEVTPSPLIVDLDGDGVETTGTYDNIYFDHDGNGFAENTGWVKVKSISDIIISNTILHYNEVWSNLHRTMKFI